VAAGFAAMGLLAREVLAQFGVEVGTADGRNEVRAVYGGFGLAVAALLAVAAVGDPSTGEGIVVAVAFALAGMAAGRLALGALSLASPRAGARLFGMERSLSPELTYMARVFGIRAIALGAGYLASEGEARRLWQRLAFARDISDTVAGAGHLRRGDLPPALPLTAMTGTYAAIGAARIALDAGQDA
jgi:hypothetical protein